MTESSVEWFRDRAARRFVACGYLPRLAALDLVWEIAQLPLYSLWTEASFACKAFAIVHCTLGDVLIGAASLALALILGREQELATWHWRRIVVLMLLLGPGYTIFSEWLNTALFRWAYSDLMPTLDLVGVRVGLSPLLQWLVLPPLALHVARRSSPLI